MLGDIYNKYEWNWIAAEEAFQKAIQINPNAVITQLRYAEYLSIMGQHEEAILAVNRAAELDPLLVYLNEFPLKRYRIPNEPRFKEIIEKVGLAPQTN